MAEQTEQQKAADAAKAAAEQEAKKAADAAKAAAKGPIVLVHPMTDASGKPLPVGTELDAKDPWVARCVMPFDLWEPKAVYDAKQRVAAEVAKAEADGKAAIEKARKGAE